MSGDEQTAQRPFAPITTTGVEIQLAFGTWCCFNQRYIARDAVRILPEKSAFGG